MNHFDFWNLWISHIFTNLRHTDRWRGLLRLPPDCCTVLADIRIHSMESGNRKWISASLVFRNLFAPSSDAGCSPPRWKENGEKSCLVKRSHYKSTVIVWFVSLWWFAYVGCILEALHCLMTSDTIQQCCPFSRVTQPWLSLWCGIFWGLPHCLFLKTFGLISIPPPPSLWSLAGLHRFRFGKRKDMLCSLNVHFISRWKWNSLTPCPCWFSSLVLVRLPLWRLLSSPLMTNWCPVLLCWRAVAPSAHPQG